MVWLTWRQHRAQILVTIGFLAVMGGVLLVHGLGSAGLTGDALSARFRALNLILGWMPMVPLVVGLFWGAPLLARELERGTHRLAWTQSVSRRRWLVTKLGGLGLAVTVAGLALGAMVSAWLTNFDGTRYANARFDDTALFGGTGVAAGAWWLFAFALGTAVGGLARRLLPAFVVTIVVYLVAMFVMFQVRPGYVEPERAVLEEDPSVSSTVPDALVSNMALLSPAGVETDVAPECANEGRETYLSCVRDAGYRSVLYYQPVDRYWRFQWTEAGILVLVSVLLAGPVVYRVARRPV